MRAVKEFIAHLAIAMLLGMVVITILDGCNPLMAFLTSRPTKVYIVVMCILGVVTAIMYIAKSRKS